MNQGCLSPELEVPGISSHFPRTTALIRGSGTNHIFTLHSLFGKVLSLVVVCWSTHDLTVNVKPTGTVRAPEYETDNSTSSLKTTIPYAPYNSFREFYVYYLKASWFDS